MEQLLEVQQVRKLNGFAQFRFSLLYVFYFNIQWNWFNVCQFLRDNFTSLAGLMSILYKRNISFNVIWETYYNKDIEFFDLTVTQDGNSYLAI